MCDNVYFHGNYESDFVYTTKARYVFEVEVKISKADFYKDFEKTRRILQPANTISIENKHDEIKSGSLGLKGFYFAIPEELVDKVEIPEYCGLIVQHSGWSTWVVKKAPVLPNAEKITQKQIRSLTTSYQYRYYNQRMKRKDQETA